MGISIPTTIEIIEQNLANYESQLNQSAPLSDRAFLRVASKVEGGNFTLLYRYGFERIKENLVLSASRDALKVLGANYGVPIKPATFFNGTAELPGTNGVDVPVATGFIGESNNERYLTDETVTTTGGKATFDFTAVNTGDIPNITVGEDLIIENTILNMETIATVTVVNENGVDEEDTEAYRRRILTVLRTVGGGGNAADYRIWAEGVTGVFRAFPYADRPSGTALPGDRTVYVEAETSIDPDGIPPTSLLDDVRDAINYDPDTGLARPPLGEIDATLWVEAITRTAFFVEVRGIDVPAEVLVETKAKIEENLDIYFRTIAPYVDGLDSQLDRDDTITDMTISTIVQDAIQAVGGSADGIGFGVTAGVFISSYQLGQGELAKAGTVTYV